MARVENTIGNWMQWSLDLSYLGKNSYSWLSGYVKTTDGSPGIIVGSGESTKLIIMKEHKEDYPWLE